MRTSIAMFMMVIGLGLVAVAGEADASDPAENAVAKSTQAANKAALGAVQTRLLDAARDQPGSYTVQLEAAESLLQVANQLRNERKIRSDMPGDLNKEYRAQQAAWAEQATPAAEAALELASNDAELAQAERVIGELYAHRITGMISGFINGPRARRHMGHALELAPEDPECNRAIGLMYLHNPRISGGDVPRAIETFERCSKEIDDDRCLILLSMAYRKHGEPAAARTAAEAALARDPESVDAKLMLKQLE